MEKKEGIKKGLNSKFNNNAISNPKKVLIPEQKKVGVGE